MTKVDSPEPPPAFFTRLLTRRDVATQLGLTLTDMSFWIWGLRPSRRYKSFEIARRNGGRPRRIQTPIKPIRDMQTTLLRELEAAYSPWPHVHGFVHHKSAVTNAEVHRGQRWILRIDLEEFFPSINFGRVRGMFMSHPFDVPADAATALAQICCHEGGLPQGAPTSPIISNLICRGLDARLAKLASIAHCSYSRYADDLCFSSGRTRFPELIVSETIERKPILNPDLRSIIVGEGFVVNEDKTRLMARFQRQRVTGLVVNKKRNVPREYRRHLRAVLYIWRTYGQEQAEAAFARARPVANRPPEKAVPEFRLVIRGQLEYLGYVRGYDWVYQGLAQVLAECDDSFAPQVPRVPRSGQVTIAGEGPSDLPHLLAAAHALRTDFPGLELLPPGHNAPNGDAELWRWLQSVKDSRNLHPRVGVFDVDTSYAAQIGAAGWVHLGNGVAAVCLARSPWLSAGQRFCIEMLHRRGTLARTDNEGRRIFLRSEFDPNGRSLDGKYEMQYPQRTTLVVDKHVARIADGKSVALAKTAFADAVLGQVQPFQAGSVDFEGFRPTLERIWEAVAAAQAACG